MESSDSSGRLIVYQSALDSFEELTKGIGQKCSKDDATVKLKIDHLNPYFSGFRVRQFLTNKQVVLYLASNYSLKDEICIDPIELLHQLWSGISKIFRQKSRRAEILNEIIFNTTDLFALQKIKTEILKVSPTSFRRTRRYF